jgi:hypothetical protein
MQHDIFWAAAQQPGLEHLHLTQNPDEIIADGLVIALVDNTPLRVHYSVHCDSNWRIRAASVSLLDQDNYPPLLLHHNGTGHWTTHNKQHRSDLTGCLDVDISITPFTNTLPIRRLNLALGETAIIDVAYISLPTLSCTHVQQRYTHFSDDEHSHTYRYESLDTNFQADITVDDNGLVLDYPGLFTRIFSPA